MSVSNAASATAAHTKTIGASPASPNRDALCELLGVPDEVALKIPSDTRRLCYQYMLAEVDASTGTDSPASSSTSWKVVTVPGEEPQKTVFALFAPPPPVDDILDIAIGFECAGLHDLALHLLVAGAISESYSYADNVECMKECAKLKGHLANLDKPLLTALPAHIAIACEFGDIPSGDREAINTLHNDCLDQATGDQRLLYEAAFRAKSRAKREEVIKAFHSYCDELTGLMNPEDVGAMAGALVGLNKLVANPVHARCILDSVEVGEIPFDQLLDKARVSERTDLTLLLVTLGHRAGLKVDASAAKFLMDQALKLPDERLMVKLMGARSGLNVPLRKLALGKLNRAFRLGDIPGIKRLLGVLNPTPREMATWRVDAYSKAKWSLVKVLFEMHPLPSASELSEALAVACHYQRLNIVQWLHESCKADLSAPDSSGSTPLYTVCVSGCEPIAEYLMQHSVEPRSYKGKEPWEVVAAPELAERVKRYALAKRDTKAQQQ